MVERLKAIEKFLGFSLPDDYRAFLLKHNGGTPEPCKFLFNRGHETEPANVNYFLAIYDGDDDNFLDEFESNKDRIPADTIAIADDPGGSLILIGVSDGNRGKIYFWESDGAADDEEIPDYRNVFFIADNFNEFIESLY